MKMFILLLICLLVFACVTDQAATYKCTRPASASFDR